MILENLQKTHRPQHEYRVVDGAAFRHVSGKFYRRSQARFEALGFRFIADIEDVTLKQTIPDPRTFIRVMADRNQTTVAAFYHVRPTLLWRLGMMLLRIPARIFDLESCSNAGEMFCTTTAPLKTETPHPETHYRDHAPRRFRIDELYQRHLENLSRRGHDDSLLRVHTAQDVIDLQNFYNQQVYDHLEQIGWVTKEYLRQQGVMRFMVDQVYDEVRRLAQERRSAAGTMAASDDV